MTPTAHEEPGRTVPGRCFCGAVRFEIDLPTDVCAHCHCGMCRRMNGAGFVTWIIAQRARFRSSEHGERSFCGVCGSSLFCELDTHPDTIDIVLAAMEGPIDRAPEMNIFWTNRVAWSAAPEALPKLGGLTGMEPVPD